MSWLVLAVAQPIAGYILFNSRIRLPPESGGVRPHWDRSIKGRSSCWPSSRHALPYPWN